MKNVLEDMKAVYNKEVFEIDSIDYMGKPPIIYLKVAKKFPYSDGLMPLSLSQIKPLLRFPDKDSEGNDMWVYDLLLHEDYENPIVLRISRYMQWAFRCTPLESMKLIGGTWNSVGLEGLSKKANRLCSIYDKKALDYLPEDVVNEFKELAENGQ